MLSGDTGVEFTVNDSSCQRYATVFPCAVSPPTMALNYAFPQRLTTSYLRYHKANHSSLSKTSCFLLSRSKPPCHHCLPCRTCCITPIPPYTSRSPLARSVVPPLHMSWRRCSSVQCSVLWTTTLAVFFRLLNARRLVS